MKVEFSLISTIDELKLFREMSIELFKEDIKCNKVVNKLSDKILEEFLSYDNDHYFIKDQDTNKIIGIFCLWNVSRNYDVYFLNQLAILPEYRLQGVATQALNFILDNYEKIVFTVKSKYLDIYRKVVNDNISIITNHLPLPKRNMFIPVVEYKKNKVELRSLLCGINVNLLDTDLEDMHSEIQENYTKLYSMWNHNIGG